MKILALGVIVAILLAGCYAAAVLLPGPFAFSRPGLAAENPAPTPSPAPLPTGIATARPAVPSLAATMTAIPVALLPSSTPLPSATPAPTITPYVTPYIYSYGPAGFPPDINPLTGLPAVDASLFDRRPVAVKVTNFPRSVRPQWGLTLADNVYEYYTETGLTRFVGIFYGYNAERVGPVRSGRLFDENVMRMYKSILVFGSADDRVMDIWMNSDLRNRLVIERPSNCPPLCRIGPKGNYNTLFVNTQQLSQYITDRGTNNERQNLDGLKFEVGAPKGGIPGTSLQVLFSNTSYHHWEYDPVTARYIRYQETQDFSEGEAYEPLIDSLTRLPISADNLVVLKMPYSYFWKSSDTEMFQVNFIGSGEAYALREGMLYPLVWERALPDALVSLRFPGGESYPLKPGNTWFEVVNDNSVFEQPGPTTWRFHFHLPEEPTPAP